jgi:UDP-glucose 4-epimerase
MGGLKLGPGVKIVVTGGAGFIGSHLCETLVERGCTVVCFDNFSIGTQDNISTLQKRKNFIIVKGDIENRNNVESAIEGSDVVFHLAARVGVKHYVEDPVGVLTANFYGTHNVLEACVKNHSARLIFGSTSEVYGRNPRMPLVEDSDRVLGPATVDRWSYSISKSAGEHLCNAYFKMHGLPVTILRYFNVYGPRGGISEYAGVVSVFIRNVLRGEPPSVHGSGLQTRCFTFVRDAVEATVRATEADEAIGETINIGSSHEIRILELADAIIKIIGRTGLRPKIVPHEEFYGRSYEDIERRVPSTLKSDKILNFRLSTSLYDGLKETIEWYNSVSHPSRSEATFTLADPV